MCAFVVLGLVFPYQTKRLAWETSLKWHILCWVECKTLTQSVLKVLFWNKWRKKTMSILAMPGSSGERTAVKTEAVVAVHSSHKGCDIGHVSEPAKIWIRQMWILYFKSVRFRFVTRSQLVQFSLDVWLLSTHRCLLHLSSYSVPICILLCD